MHQFRKGRKAGSWSAERLEWSNVDAGDAVETPSPVRLKSAILTSGSAQSTGWASCLTHELFLAPRQ